MNRKKFFFPSLLLLAFIISFNFCAAVGIVASGPNPFQFSPFLNQTWGFEVNNAPRINISLSRQPLAEYATLIDPDPLGGPRKFKVNLALPNNLSRPGKWSFLVKACEAPENTGGLMAVACAAWPIILYVPYPGYYVEGIIAKSNIEINKSAEIKFLLSNKGSNDINSIEIRGWIFNENKDLVINLTKDFDELFESGKSKTFSIPISSLEISPGNYSIKSQVYYSDKNLSILGELMIGDLNAYVDEIKPIVLDSDEINKLAITIGVNWDLEKTIFAEVLLDGKLMTKTSTEKLGKFGKNRFLVYIDTKGFEIGKHDLGVKMYYAGKSKTDTIPVEIADLADKGEPVKEQPKGDLTMILMAVIAGIVVLVALGLLIYYMFLKK